VGLGGTRQVATRRCMRLRCGACGGLTLGGPAGNGAAKGWVRAEKQNEGEEDGEPH